jgi:hypothetical protein
LPTLPRLPTLPTLKGRASREENIGDSSATVIEAASFAMWPIPAISMLAILPILAI